jgi:tetratricopeptide (TPR) repeat protein
VSRPLALWFALLAVWSGTQLFFGAVAPWAVGATALALAILVAVAFFLLPGGIPLSRVTVAFLASAGALFALQFLPLSFAFPVTVAVRASHGIAGAYPGTADAFLTLRCLAQFSAYVLTAILVLKLRREGLSSVVMLQGIVAVLLVQAVYALVQQFAGLAELPFYGPRVDTSSASGTFVNRNTFGGVMAMGAVAAASLAYARFVARRRIDAGMAWALAAALFLVALVLSRSRGGAVAAAVGLVTLPLLHRGRGSLTGALAVLLAGAVGVALADPSVLLGRFSEQEIREAQRWRIWTSTTSAALHQPVLGFGVGTHPHAYHPYQPVNLPGEVHHAHNEYVNFFFEGGAVWLVILAGSFALWGTGTWQAAALLPGPDRIIPAAAIAAALAEATHSVVDFDLRITSAGMLFAVMIGLGGAVHRSKTEAPSRAPGLCAAVGAIAALILLFLHLDPEAKVDRAAQSDAPRAAALALEALKVSPYNHRAAWILARATDELLRFATAADLWPAHPGLQKDVGLRFWVHYGESGDRRFLEQSGRSLRRLFEQRPAEVADVMKDLWWKDAPPVEFEPLLPPVPAAWGEFAGFLVAKGKWREGLDVFRRGCPEVPENAPVFDMFAARLTAEGQWGMAAAILDRRLKVKSDPAAHGAAARAWGRLEAWDRALPEAELARRTDPLNAEWLALTGDLLRGDHKLEKALEAYMQAVRLAPLNIDYLLRRAELYGEMKLWSWAAADCRHVLASRPADRQATLSLVQCLVAQGERAEARSLLEDLLRHVPGDAAAGQMLDSLK